MTRKTVLFLLSLSLASLAFAQESPNYKIEQSTFNNGGNPSPELTSPSYKMTLDSIGDGVAATGMTSANNKIDSGLPAANIPPGEVLNLLFADQTTFNWSAEASVGTYNVYRGTVANLSSGYGACFTQGLTAPQAIDAENPPAGQCFFYLVTAENRLTEEGTMGKKSDGTPRTNGTPCS